MAERADPIGFETVITLPDGKPTSFFIQQWNSQLNVNSYAFNDIVAGAGLEGGGSLSDGDVTFNLPALGSEGTYGSATEVPVVVIDEFGRVTGVTTETVTATVAVEDDGAVFGNFSIFNFVGAEWTLTDAGSGQLDIEVTASAGVDVQDDGVGVVTGASTLNFAGAGVVVTDVAGVATVTIAGSSGSALDVQDDGVSIDSNVDTINFTGAGVVVTAGVSGTVEVAISGGGGGGGGGGAAFSGATVSSEGGSFGTSFATRGTFFTPTVDLVVDSISAIYDTFSSTDEFAGVIATFTGTTVSDTVVTVLGQTPSTAVGSTARTELTHTFSSPITLTAGTKYFIGSTLTNGSGTSTNRIKTVVGLSMNAPGTLDDDTSTWYLQDNALATSDAIDSIVTSAAPYLWINGNEAEFTGVLVQDDGVDVVSDAQTFNFAGAGVVVTDVGGVATVTIAGGGGGGAIPVQDDGVEIVAAPTALNFTGGGVTVTDVSGVATIEITGGGGGGGGSTAKVAFGGIMIGDSGYTTFSDASASKGIPFSPTVDVEVLAVNGFINPASTSETYTAQICTWTGSTGAAGTVGAVVATSDTLTAQDTQQGFYRFTFSSNPTLTAGTVYVVVINRTDGTGTSALVLLGDGNVTMTGPFTTYANGTFYFNTTALTASQTTSGNTTSSEVAIYLECVEEVSSAAGAGMFGPLKPPTTTDFSTTVAEGTATGSATDDSVRGLLVASTGAANDDWYGAYKAASVPGVGTDTYICRLLYTAGEGGFPGAGFELRNSTNGRKIHFGFDGDWDNSINLVVQRWAGTSFGATQDVIGLRGYDVWLKVEIDSTGLCTFFYSACGAQWYEYYSENVSAYLEASGGGTFDQIGFAAKYHTQNTYLTVPFFSDDGTNS